MTAEPIRFGSPLSLDWTSLPYGTRRHTPRVLRRARTGAVAWAMRQHSASSPCSSNRDSHPVLGQGVRPSRSSFDTQDFQLIAELRRHLTVKATAHRWCVGLEWYMRIAQVAPLTESVPPTLYG